MKNFSVLVTFAALLSVPGFAQETPPAQSNVVEELSEEAAILRALVEEYKAKTAGKTSTPPRPTTAQTPASLDRDEQRPSLDPTLPAGSLAVPPKPEQAPPMTRPQFKPAEINVPIPEQTKEPAKESISSVSNLISEPIESVSSVISESTANAEADAMKKSIVYSDAPSASADMPKLENPATAIKEPSASISTPRIATETPIATKTEAKRKPAITFVPTPTTSIILQDTPPPAEVPVVEDTAAEVGNQAADMVAQAEEKVDSLEDAIKKAEQSLADRPAVAAADTMNEVDTPTDAPAPEATEKPDQIKKTESSSSDAPLVIATKRTTPKKEQSNSTTASTQVAATEPAEPEQTPAASPEATARSITPLKDFGRMLFGPRDGGPRGSIFKRNQRNQPDNPPPPSSTTSTSAQ